MELRSIVSEGQVVFDRAEDAYGSTLVVTVPDAGTVSELSPETREAVRGAKRNEDFDTSDDVPCAEVVYLDPDMSDEAYTFPKNRLYAPNATEITHGHSPIVWAKADMLVRLYDQLPLDEILAMDADVEGQVLIAAKELMAMRGIDHAERSGDGYDEEILDCPDCTGEVTLTEPIESTGEGVAYGYIRCTNEDCAWEGREEWVHTQTVATAGEGVSVGEPTKEYFGEES